MNKIKVVNIIHSFCFGGTESFLYNYLEKFDFGKYEVTIIAMREKSNRMAIEKFEKIGCKILLTNNWEKKPFKSAIEIFKIFKKNNFDIIHVNLTHTNFYFLILGWVSSIKIRISHSHLVSSGNNINTKIKHKFYSILIKKFATEYVACSYEAGIELYGKNQNVKIIKNAINLDKFRYNDKYRKLLRKKYNIKDNEILIGNIGRLNNQKNQIFLIEILEQLRKKNNKYKLAIIGDGELKEFLIEKISKSKLNDFVILLNGCENINEYYSLFDLFLFPSLYEGLGIVLIEAQAAGLSCFVSKDVIPYEAGILDNYYRIPLSISASEWADTIDSADYNRISYSIAKEKLMNSGYSIDNEKYTLMNYYDQLIISNKKMEEKKE